MAITITATLDASGVKTGATQASDAIDGLWDQAQATSEGMANSLEDANNETRNLTDEIQALQAELSQVGSESADAFNQLESGADRAGKSMEKVAPPANIAQKITAVSTGFMAVVQGIKTGVEFAKKFDEAFRSMADEGNEAAGRVVVQLDKIHGGFAKLKNDPLVQDSFNLIADGTGKASEYLDFLGKDAVEVVNKWSGMMTYIGESFGIFEEGTHKARAAMEEFQATEREGLGKKLEAEAAAAAETEAAAKREAAVKGSLTEIEKTLSGIEEARFKAAFQGTLDLIDSEEQLREAIEAEAEAIKERAKEGKLSDEDRRRSLSKIEAAENRIHTIRENHAQAVKDAAAEATKVAADESAKREKLARDEVANKARIEADFEALKNKAAADELDRQAKAHQASIDMERRAIDERKRLLTGKDVNGAEQLLQGQDPALVRRAFAERQAAEAEQQARAKAKSNTHDSPEERRRKQKEIAEARQAAEAEAESKTKAKQASSGGDSGENKWRDRREVAKSRHAAAEAAEAKVRARQAASSDGGDWKEEGRRDQADVARARQAALKNAQRQFDDGKSDPRAVMAAQQGLADQTVRAAFKSGNLSKETAAALHESTREIIKNQNELDQVTKEVAEINKLMQAASLQGNRRRAQNAGARQ